MRDQLFGILVRVIVLMTTIPVHEAAHALAAKKLGDDTAARAGRLTLNPLAHFDLVGSVCLLAFGIGWAKPVPINPANFKNPKRGMALSSAAGPASNLLMALITLILAKLCYYLPMTTVTDTLYIIFINMCVLNIALGIFNLMPIPPFDGGRIFGLFLPQRLYFNAMKYERYVLLAVLALLWLGVLDAPLHYLNTTLLSFLDFITGWVDAIAIALLR